MSIAKALQASHIFWMHRTPKLPKLIRFVLVNSAIGIAIGWFIAGLLVWFNIHGLGELVFHSQQWPIAVIVLGSSFGITFGFGYLTTAILLLPTDKDDFDRF